MKSFSIQVTADDDVPIETIIKKASVEILEALVVLGADDSAIEVWDDDITKGDLGKMLARWIVGAASYNWEEE